MTDSMAKQPLTISQYQKLPDGSFPVVQKPLTIVKYGDNYHVSLLSNATGDPTLGTNAAFTEGMGESEAIGFIAGAVNTPNVIGETLLTKSGYSGSPFIVDASTPIGAISGSELQGFIDVNHSQPLSLTFINDYMMDKAYSTESNVSIHPEYKVDDGDWEAFKTHSFAMSGGRFNSTSFFDKAMTASVDGKSVVSLRLVLDENTLQENERIASGQMNLFANYIL